jgi:zinc protease
MAAFRDRHLRPSNAILVLAGDLPAEPLRSVEESFGGWADAPTPPAPPAVFAPPGRSLILVNRPGSVQADIRIARAAVARRDPAYFPLMVGNTVLGGGASSRLFMNVREEKGYAYDARSSAQPYRDGGMFAAITQVRNEVLGEALETVLEELRRMGSEPVADEELETAKNYMSGTFVLRLETPDSQAAQILGTRLLGLPLEYLEQYTPRVRAVSADAIQAAAGTYMNPDEAAIVVVGDAAALAPGLRAFGNLMVEEAQTE